MVAVRGEEIVLRSDVERAALDAYSVVWEGSRKLVRDHQAATRAAVAAALLRVSNEWSAAPEYQTNGVVQQEVGEYGGRLLLVAANLVRCAVDDLDAVLAGDDEPSPGSTPQPREPRVWKFGVHSDIDADVNEVVGDVTGIHYHRVDGKKFCWRGNVMELGVGALLFDEGTVTEVVTAPAAPRPGDTVRLWLDNDTSVVGRYYLDTEDDDRQYVEANGQHRLVEVNGNRRHIEVVESNQDGGEPR